MTNQKGQANRGLSSSSVWPPWLAVMANSILQPVANSSVLAASTDTELFSTSRARPFVEKVAELLCAKLLKVSS